MTCKQNIGINWNFENNPLSLISSNFYHKKMLLESLTFPLSFYLIWQQSLYYITTDSVKGNDFKIIHCTSLLKSKELWVSTLRRMTDFTCTILEKMVGMLSPTSEKKWTPFHSAVLIQVMLLEATWILECFIFIYIYVQPEKFKKKKKKLDWTRF